MANITKHHPNIYLESSDGCAAGCAGAFIGGITGGLALPMYGFYTSGFWTGLLGSLITGPVGIALGGAIGLGAAIGLETMTEKKDDRLERLAIQGNKPYVTVSYKDDSVKCYLRDDYQNDLGHTFGVKTNDHLADAISLHFSPMFDDKFILELRFKDSKNQMPMEAYERGIYKIVHGLSMVRGSAVRDDDHIACSLSLESKVVGPDEISQISTAATELLKTTREYKERYHLVV